MNIASKLGLEVEIFYRMVTITKMLFSNVLGHAAELCYEKHLKKNSIKFEKAPTDVHYDYLVKGERYQVKRFETESTNQNFIGVNLTKTHGDRSGPGAFYEKSDFDKLVLADIGFNNFRILNVQNLPSNRKYLNRLPGRIKFERETQEELSGSQLNLIKALKAKNKEFPGAIENLRKNNNWSYQKLNEEFCNLTLKEIDSLFSEENFRLVTGAKGFAAEEHFNLLLEENNISYVQDPDIYSKVDHWVKEKIRVQVKIPNERSTNEEYWGIKTHKSHGHGVGELLKADEFDIVALFIGFEMEKDYSKYFPKKTTTKFIFIPVSDLERHPDFPSYFKRISKVKKDVYNINDISVFKDLE